jgi:hypothetical protein
MRTMLGVASLLLAFASSSSWGANVTYRYCMRDNALYCDPYANLYWNCATNNSEDLHYPHLGRKICSVQKYKFWKTVRTRSSPHVGECGEKIGFVSCSDSDTPDMHCTSSFNCVAGLTKVD